jgi:ATP adenylyltransferase
MNRLYAPWRTQYAQDSDAPTKQASAHGADCVFCIALAAQNDDHYYVLKRYKHNAILLNTFPYNAGHLLIIPYAHVAALEALTAEIRAETMEIINEATILLQKALNPDGFNIGINLGKAAGGSIPSHIHTHLLPRWTGDTSFLPLLSNTKPISIDLQQLFKQLQSMLHASP